LILAAALGNVQKVGLWCLFGGWKIPQKLEKTGLGSWERIMIPRITVRKIWVHLSSWSGIW
jgi:hypothetical protein